MLGEDSYLCGAGALFSFGPCRIHNERTVATLAIREILPSDNGQLAALIVEVMTEIGAVGEGYSIKDAEVQAMSFHYGGGQAMYFVLVDSDTVIGGGGFAPLIDAADDVCELRKMYFSPLLAERERRKR